MAIAKYVLYAFVPLILVNIKLFDHKFIIIIVIIITRQGTFRLTYCSPI